MRPLYLITHITFPHQPIITYHYSGLIHSIEFRSLTYESKLAVEEIRLHRNNITFQLERELLDLRLELEDSYIEMDHLSVLEIEAYEGRSKQVVGTGIGRCVGDGTAIVWVNWMVS